MRRVLVLVTLAAVATAVPVTALAATTGKTHHFTDHMLGALVQTKGGKPIYAYKVQTSNDGPGANVTVDTVTSSSAGIVRATTYLTNGSVRTTGTYHIKGANAAGLVLVTVRGHITGGTGAFKGDRGTFHGTGTDNPKTTMVTLTLVGTSTR